MSASEPESQINLANKSVLKILRAASERFGRRGFAGASLGDIAREAGVSKSLLHYHFDSKVHLFIEVQLQMSRDLLESVGRLTDATGPTMDSFFVALDAVYEFLEQELDAMCVMLEVRTVARDHPEISDRLDDYLDQVVHLIVVGIGRALGPLIDRLAIPPERVARLLLTQFHGLLVDLTFAQTDDARDRVRRTYEDIRNLLVPAIFRPTS